MTGQKAGGGPHSELWEQSWARLRIGAVYVVGLGGSTLPERIGAGGGARGSYASLRVNRERTGGLCPEGLAVGSRRTQIGATVRDRGSR